MRLNILVIISLMIPCLIAGVTHTVKLDGSGDFTSIQAALDASASGDTVLVYPGRYFENLTIQTNNLCLTSLEAPTNNPAYVDSTVIDGNHAGRCIQIIQHVQNTYIRGFTVTNGFSTGGAGAIGLPYNTLSILKNLNIYGNASALGGGLNIGAATVTLSGVSIHDNYSVNLGGGIYASAGGGYVNTITFDPVNRCSIYDNRSGSGQDIFIQNATSNLNVYLDTFSVATPTTYYAVYLSDNNLNYHINIDIQNVHHQEIDHDIYVAPDGNDSNDGLSPSSPMKTIHEGIYRIASDSLNQRTVHILPGTYSRTDNDQIFPIALKSWVKVQGSGIDSTTVIGEPHPLINNNVVTLIFSIIMAPDVFLSDMSITSRNIDLYCTAIGGDQRHSSVNFTNLCIYNIECSDSYTGEYEVVYFGATNERESIWENVTIENIAPAKVQLITSSGGISETGEISAMKGKFSNCTFRSARSTFVSSSAWGPPLISIKGDQRLEFENCLFENLSVDDNDANVIQISGIQYPQQQNHFIIDNCSFSNITSHDYMINIGSFNNPLIDITNCTFAGNHGDVYALMVNGDVNIVNSIFSNDTPYQIKVNPMDGNPNEHTHLAIDYSLVRDGIAGILPYSITGNTIEYHDTNISGNPLFLGGDDVHDPLYYSLAAGSPCINTGTPDTLGLDLLPYDLAGNWRVWNGRIDMGCYEYGSEPWVANDDPYIPEIEPGLMLSNYPNPFNPTTTIAYQLPKSGKVRLDIYNLKGQHVTTLVDEAKVAGSQTAIWNGTDSSGSSVASGVYIYRLSFDGMNQTNKMLLMK